jgi:hypothetical protein
MKMDKRLIHEKLMNEHRLVTNQITDIKTANFEITPQVKKEIQTLENKLILISKQLYNLYNEKK